MTTSTLLVVYKTILAQLLRSAGLLECTVYWLEYAGIDQIPTSDDIVTVQEWQYKREETDHTLYWRGGSILSLLIFLGVPYKKGNNDDIHRRTGDYIRYKYSDVIESFKNKIGIDLRIVLREQPIFSGKA